MPSGKKRKRHKMAVHKRKKRLRKNRHKKKKQSFKGFFLKSQIIQEQTQQYIRLKFVLCILISIKTVFVRTLIFVQWNKNLNNLFIKTLKL